MIITLTKLKPHDLQVMLAAVKVDYENHTILKETFGYDIHHITQSVLQELAELIFDKSAKSYKQSSFSFKLRWHQAKLLVNALNKYRKEHVTPHDANTALSLVLQIDPKI